MKFPFILVYFVLIALLTNAACTSCGILDKSKFVHINGGPDKPTTPDKPDITDKYKTIDDLLEGIKNGDTITEEIAKKFAAKKAPNSITNEQICKIAKTKKVNDDILLALAEKATISIEDVDRRKLCELPDKVLAKMIDNIPDNSIEGRNIRWLITKQPYSPDNIERLCKKVSFKPSDIHSFFLFGSIPENFPIEAVKILLNKIPDNSIKARPELDYDIANAISDILVLYTSKNEKDEAAKKEIIESLFNKVEKIPSPNIVSLLYFNKRVTEEEMKAILNKIEFVDSQGNKLEEESTNRQKQKIDESLNALGYSIEYNK
jgi:hypothetical protein